MRRESDYRQENGGRASAARKRPRGPNDAELAFYQLPFRKRASELARVLAFLFFGCAVVTLLVALVSSVVSSFISTPLPTPEQLSTLRIGQSTKIYDRNGRLLEEVVDPNGGRRTIVPSDQISPWVKEATIATEDPNFYREPGVDPVGVLRAIYYLVREQRVVTGGSTITQQLVKNTLLSPQVTLDRKIREVILALRFSARYPKDDILAAYLNTIYYGNLSYGVQAAAQSYFRKDAAALDLAEASLLAGLPQAPTAYDPCQNPLAALNRQKTVLNAMVEHNYIDTTQAEAAANETGQLLGSAEFDRNCRPRVNTVAPHFVQYVRQLLEQQYGPDVVYKEGLQVYTTLDPTIEKIAQEEAQRQIAGLQAKHVTNAAVVVIDPRTGQILAMLGSVDFSSKSIAGQVNVATSLRQPGSSIKPLTYVTALEKGWTLATPILDTRTLFPDGNKAYIPDNYDHRYAGIVNPRLALANSLNIPAVRTLYFVGVPALIDTARQLGITTFDDPSKYGLALTLGGGDVKLLELTGAYAVFANGGRRVPPTPFLKIVDGEGNVLLDNETNPPPGQLVMDPRYAYLITNVLSDNQARTPDFGPNSLLKLSRPAAAKTGTTNDWRDNWTLGYTPELTVGVWVGNSDNSPMVNSTGITGAAPIWHNVMERIYAEVAPYNSTAPHDFVAPVGIFSEVVCDQSGLLPTPACPADSRHAEIFLAETAPREYDKFWTGEWGATCPPPEQSSKAATVNLKPYPVLVQQALARGMPEGLAGLVPCQRGGAAFPNPILPPEYLPPYPPVYAPPAPNQDGKPHPGWGNGKPGKPGHKP